MKIVCKKGNDARKSIELIKQLLETSVMNYPVLQDDLVLDICLESIEGLQCPKNSESFYFDDKDYDNIAINTNNLEDYYNNDALTKLYNRARYERDIVKLQEDGADGLICIYIDVVGLHEINNHLGHAAGDSMLCCVADGIRQIFPHSLAYRIGGDEFVIFSFNQTEAQINQSVSALRKLLHKENYEISVGVHTNNNCSSLIKTINSAEYAMRYDKTQFYNNDGKKRQMRILNYKLEKILLENKDANQFLNVIASEYKGVYMVNPDMDICRYIYIPEYFKDILEKNDGIFSKSIREYCDTFVCEADRSMFMDIFDFDSIMQKLSDGNQINFTYRKKDGGNVRLQITIYDQNSSNTKEMLWIFMDADRVQSEIL